MALEFVTALCWDAAAVQIYMCVYEMTVMLMGGGVGKIMNMTTGE